MTNHLPQVDLPSVVWFQEGPGVRNHQFTERGVKLLNGRNIVDNKLIVDNTKTHISEEEANSKYEHFLVKEGDLIIASSGIKVDYFHKKIAFAKKEDLPLCMNTSTIRFRTLDPNCLDINYFKFYLRTGHFADQVDRYITGSAQLNFGPSHLKQMKILLPPLPIQKQIAAILEKADAAREKRRQANQLTEQFLQSAFLEMFGDPGINKRRLPTTRLADLVRKDDKINYGVVQPGDDYPGGVPIVRIGDFQGMRVDKANLKRIDPNIEAAYKRSRLVGDEVLLACVGSIGMVALADPSVKGFNTVRAVARIRCGDDLDRLFLAFYLSTSFSQSFFSRETRTVSQPTLNIRQIEETQILVPPLSQQQRFAALVEKVEGLRGKQRESEKELEKLFNSLMQKAFSGELVQ